MPPAVREAIRHQLVAAGCPPDVASRLAAETTAERKDGGEFLCLLGACVPPGDNAVESLVDSVLADNAEANDGTRLTVSAATSHCGHCLTGGCEAASQAAPAAAVASTGAPSPGRLSPASPVRGRPPACFVESLFVRKIDDLVGL